VQRVHARGVSAAAAAFRRHGWGVSKRVVEAHLGDSFNVLEVEFLAAASAPGGGGGGGAAAVSAPRAEATESNASWGDGRRVLGYREAARPASEGAVGLAARARGHTSSSNSVEGPAPAASPPQGTTVVVQRGSGRERFGRRAANMPAAWGLAWTFEVEVEAAGNAAPRASIRSYTHSKTPIEA
jgi:hypothetical protein